VDLGLANARVLVTGGASNIGRGIVHGFAAEGARIVIADVDEAQAAKVRAEAVERGAAEAELALGDLTTKAALIALARTTAKEHGRHGIRSNVVCPGLVLPDGPGAVGAASLRAAGQDAVFNEQQIDYLTKDSPLRRLTDAADIANAVTWISSARAARQVTGQVISVSGGYTMP